MALPSWKEVSVGGIITEAGNSAKYGTGSWRTFRPVINMERCTHCMICWIYCSDATIMVKDQKLVGVDLVNCKGCGICAHECPRKAITMVEEITVREGA